MPHYEGPEEPRAIDLFAGVGGLTDGFLDAGINIKHAYEKDPMARLSYRVWNQSCNIAVHTDATEIRPDLYRNNIDIVAGGPPCQTFSSNQGETRKDTERNKLAFALVEWAEALNPNPKVIVLENVTGLKNAHQETFNRLLDAIEDLGYQTHAISLNAKDYGVPQDRERVFILGVRNDIEPPRSWEPPVNCKEGQRSLAQFGQTAEPKSYLTVREALDHLPDPLEPTRPVDDPINYAISEAGAAEANRWTNARIDPESTSGFIERDGEEIAMPTNHVAADHSRSTREKMAERDLGRNKQPTTSRRLDPDSVAPTVCSSKATPPIHYQGKSPSNPDGDVEQVRRITVREAATLQGFFPERTFGGTKSQQFQAVANAVPPPLARALGRHIKENIIRHGSTEKRKVTT